MRPDDGAHACCLLARGDDALATGLLREPGTAGDEVGGQSVDALLAQIGGIEVGEDGDAQDLEVRAGLAGHRRAQRLEVVRVHGQERSAGFGGIAGRPLHGILDVEKLHVEEHAPLVARQLAREIETAAHGQLEADLVKPDRVAKRGDKSARLLDGWHIEGDDQPVARAHACQAAGLL